MRQPRQTIRRINDFPWIYAVREMDGLQIGTIRPIMNFEDDDDDPKGYRDWCRLYKKRRKAGG